jgi:excisionase family DNA binding protein
MAITVGEIKLLTLEEVSEIIGIGPVSIRRWIREGKLKAKKIGPRYYVQEEHLKEFLTSPEPAAEEE